MSSETHTVAEDDRTVRPTAFISYAHGDTRWDATVLDFATALRRVGGIDADIDQWHLIEGQDWARYGPAAIDDSDFTLLVVSPAYRNAWEGRNPPGRNAGAAREAATAKAIFDRDQSEFLRRVKVVLLPGADAECVPSDLFTLRRYEVRSFDLSGLDDLLRSIIGKPLNAKPVLGPLAALPSGTVADLKTEAGGGDREIADSLAARVASIERKIASLERDGTDDETPELLRLREAHAAAKASLVAVERALPTGEARQRLVGDYLNAQLYFSAGAYRAADSRLVAVRDRLRDEDADPAAAVLEPCLRDLTDVMLELNKRMRNSRYAAVKEFRHPEPPAMDLARYRRSGVRDFYEVARCAMTDWAAEPSLSPIRTAILRGRVPEEKHAAGFYARYTDQQVIATSPLALAPPSEGGSAGGAYLLAEAHLDGTADRVASDVLAALAKAHLEIHLVERRRSGPVGTTLDRGRDDIDEDREHLRRSIVLNTFALSISETLPWIFAANEAEREVIKTDWNAARRALSPAPAMWHARQVGMLALYRRSHGFRLLGDHERAYNDLRMLQRIGRLARLARDEDALTRWVDTLEALAEYRIGELYRADHDYMQALVHLCRSHDSVETLRKAQGSTIAKELAHLEIKLSLGKAKAFFEIGAMKRSLKWHLTAWRWLLALEAPGTKLGKAILEVEGILDQVKHDLVLYKDHVQDAIAGVVERICEHDVAFGHRALAADILIRISHLLTVLRLPEDAGLPDDAGLPEHASVRPPGADSSALRCLRRAAELDEHNLLVQSGLLRYEMHHPNSIANRGMADPMSCWPSGASDVDQFIRAAEHLMLARLSAAGGPEVEGPAAVARALMGHFMTHTDSINLRGAILHHYLMRRRAEDREPWWADADSNDDAATPAASTRASAPYLEFVCLRRFGSFTPFMPRPAAVSAVGGGYLVRVVKSAEHGGACGPRMFNIVVDPGEGAVNNLYAMGLSIGDIDMVLATHDHPEHLSALDAILSLRKEFEDREYVKSAVHAGVARDKGSQPRLLILGNRSVVNRYSFLNGDGEHLVQHIADASVLGGNHIPEGVTIVQLPTKHKDLGGHDASGFVLSYSSDDPGGDETPLRIAFMADTAIEGLRIDQHPGNPIDQAWTLALESDIVVAHVSDVPSGELRAIAQLPELDDQEAIDRFDAGVRKLATERPGDASQLMHALSLVPPDPRAHPHPVSLLSGAVPDGDQLYLSGLLEVCKRMDDVESAADGGARILIVGELKEQLGSFRGTIAREINARVLGLPDIRHGTSAPLIALTADIGLRVRLSRAPDAAGVPQRKTVVLCSTCSYNNDRLDMERFHPPQDMYDVCVKGDHEALYWNCDIHDPRQRRRAMFVEQMGGYNPFAAGGRYHG